MTIRAILTDIEGTTTSLAFVQDVLFPYAARHMAAFVAAQHAVPEIHALLQAVCAEPDAKCTATDLGSVIHQLEQWMAADRKVTPLKALQGLLWEQGYRQGQLIGQVYPDAVAGLRRWHAQGLLLAVYSSGSVQAQQLLFGYSEAGDLRPLFSAYFDTRVGPKQASDSYRQIAAQLALPAAAILFLSDVAAELDAAAEAGLQTYALLRNSQAVAGLQHRWATRFDDISVA